MSASRIRHHLNVQAVLVSIAITLVTALGLYLLWGYQESRILRTAMNQVKEFKEKGAEAKDPEKKILANDLALRHLSQYLVFCPDDPEGLEIEGELLFARGDWNGAVSVYEHLLGIEKANWQAQQEARRRLAEIYIAMSDSYRNSSLARIDPERTSKQYRYHVAEIRADQLIKENARAKRPVHDAEAHRLRAMALEGQIIPGNTSLKVSVVPGQDSEQKTLKEVTELEYKKAYELDKGDMVSARRLAEIYLKSSRTSEAKAVLADLLGVAARSLVEIDRESDHMSGAKAVRADLHDARTRLVEVRKVRYAFLKGIGDATAATLELKDAYAEDVKYLGDPEKLQIIRMLAEDALTSEHRNTAEASRWLDKVPEPLRNEPGVLTLRGWIDYLEQDPEKAIRTWREGLVRADGADAGLTQNLALVLLELGRDREAVPFVDRYRQLVGQDNPVLRYLEGLQDEHAGRYSRAIERLKWARDRLPQDFLQGSLNVALGRCYERQQEWAEAEMTYRAAIQVVPKSAPLRDSLARLLLRSKPAEAAEQLEQALASYPDEPSLLITLAEVKLQEQRSQSREGRNWADFDEVLKRAVDEIDRLAKVAPQNKAINPLRRKIDLLRADRMAAAGGSAQAVEFLTRAIEKNPQSLELTLRLAGYLLDLGRADQALQVLEKASNADAVGDRGTLRSLRARVMIALGRGREARALLLQGVDKLPATDRDEVWTSLVLYCEIHGDPDTTRAAYNEWIRLLPNDPRPKLALLETEIQANPNDQEAIHARLQSLPHDEPDDLTWRLAQARERLWRRSITKNDEKTRAALLKEAEGLVEGVLRDIKLDSNALLLKGFILEEEFAGGKEAAAAAGAIDSYSLAYARGNATALLRLINLLARLGNDPELQRLRQSDPSKQIAHVEVMAYLRHGKRKEAIAIIEESLGGQSSGIQPWQAAALASLGEGEKAEAALRLIAEHESDKLEPWLAVVRSQVARGRSKAAAETIAEIKRRVKIQWPELLEAQCRRAAADRPAADKAFGEAAGRYPEVPDVQLAAAQYFEERGNLDLAEVSLRRVLARKPDDRALVLKLADVLLARTDRPDASKQALELLGPESATTNTAEERLVRAAVLGKSGDRVRMQEAIDLLEVLVADLAADNAVAVNARDLLAKLLLATGRANQASKVAAISANRGLNVAAVVLYAESLLQDKQFDAVEAQCKRLEVLDPGRAYAANLRARVILGRSKPGEAAVALEDAYRASEKSAGAEAFGREAFSLMIGMGPDARVVAERLGLRLAEKYPSLSWMPASFLARRQDFGKALDLCQTAVAAAVAGRNGVDLRETCRIALEVAIACRNETTTTNLQKANEVFALALRHVPENDDLRVLQAMINHLLGRFDEEVRLYRAVLSNQPNNPVVLNNLAWALSEGLNQPSEALEKIDEVVRLVGRVPNNIDTRGVILSRLGRHEQAIEELKWVVQSAPTDIHYYHLAQAYKKMGRAVEFRKALEESRQKGLTAAALDSTERVEFESLPD